MISCMWLAGVLLFLSICSNIVIVSLMGMLVYRLVISKDANVALCGMCVSLILLTIVETISHEGSRPIQRTPMLPPPWCEDHHRRKMGG